MRRSGAPPPGCASDGIEQRWGELVQPSAAPTQRQPQLRSGQADRHVVGHGAGGLTERRVIRAGRAPSPVNSWADSLAKDELMALLLDPLVIPTGRIEIRKRRRQWEDGSRRQPVADRAQAKTKDAVVRMSRSDTPRMSRAVCQSSARLFNTHAQDQRAGPGHRQQQPFLIGQGAHLTGLPLPALALVLTKAGFDPEAPSIPAQHFPVHGQVGQHDQLLLLTGQLRPSAFSAILTELGV